MNSGAVRSCSEQVHSLGAAAELLCEKVPRWDEKNERMPSLYIDEFLLMRMPGVGATERESI